MIEQIKNWLGIGEFGHTFGAARSSKWPAVRRAYLKDHPTCAVCGTKNNLQVHHQTPFSHDRSLELNPQNFIVLCEGGEHSCHLIFGHLYNFQSFNPNVVSDAIAFKDKISKRPPALAGIVSDE